MQIQRLPLDQAEGHVLLHNIVRGNGRRLLRKGAHLTSDHLASLHDLGIEMVEVAVRSTDPADPDVWEDEAAARLAEALAVEQVEAKAGVGGRINFYADVPGVFCVDGERLLSLNTLPGITLATLPPYAVVGVGAQAGDGSHGKANVDSDGAQISPRTRQIATLKIIPYAVPQSVLTRAVVLVRQPAPLWLLRPLLARRVALLVVSDGTAYARLRAGFEPPTRARLQRLGSDLAHVAHAPHDELAVAEAATRLAATYDLLIIVGQTSIMDADDLVPRALRKAGATVTVQGAPVDPGNLLAVAFAENGTPLLCAPGCARSPAHNVVDLVLPRLLVGERLINADVAAMGLGGLLV